MKEEKAIDKDKREGAGSEAEPNEKERVSSRERMRASTVFVVHNILCIPDFLFI